MFHIILDGVSIGSYATYKEASQHLVPRAYVVAPCVWEVMQMVARQKANGDCPF